jgi:DNA-binding NarL/FixJ family response regulator
MSSNSVRLGPSTPGASYRTASANRPATSQAEERHTPPERAGNAGAKDGKARVFIAAHNRLLREALARMLTRRGGFDVLGLEEETRRGVDDSAVLDWSHRVQTVVLTSGELPERDFLTIRKIRMSAPEVKILFLGMSGDEHEFFRYIRAGIHGCLLRDATAEDVLSAVRAVHAGEAVCPGTLCLALFRYFERETSVFPSAGMSREMGLTRREQQLIPLIARGMTNKEIASHFCLSEQTVKNHLHRMKHKIGADDRLGIVQMCQEQGFLV